MAKKKDASDAKDKDRVKRRKALVKGLKIALLVFLLLIVIGGVAGAAVLISYVATTPPFDSEKLQTVETSYVYDRNGELITTLHDEEKRVIVRLEDIPKHVQDAFVAAEDERFYKHIGFDPIGLVRALLINIRTRSISQGASTITQQVAQGAFLGTEDTIKRKVQEIWLAIQMERHYSKEAILEMYLNRVFFGGRYYGIEMAAQAYFNKSASELSIAEAALLAGILPSPNLFNPHVSEEAAVKRMKLVLGNMHRLEMISEEEYREALEEELVFAEPPTEEYPHPYFLDYVIHRELVEILSNMPIYGSVENAYEAIYNDGLRIYTTMDSSFQEHVENVLNQDELYPQTLMIDMPKVREAIEKNGGRRPSNFPSAYIDEENGVPQPQSALVLTDPKTGEILALGGGRHYRKNVNELLRFTSKRQPGSAIKPVITYGPAFEEGLLAPGSALDDSPYVVITESGQDWCPENYDGAFRGLISVRTALARSYNIPAVLAYEKVGLRKGAEYARQMGLSSLDPSQAKPSWTLGTCEVTAIEMAQAYGVFANDGVRMDAHTIRKVENRNGEVLYEHKADPQQVLSPEATFLVNSILQDVVKYTTATGLQATRPLAAKTGTTERAQDVYLAAYAPNLVATFWMGYDEPTLGSINNGWRYTTRILREVFRKTLDTLPREDFSRPSSGIEQVEVCSKSGLLATDLCREAGTVVTDYFLSREAPRLECDLHIEVDICTESGLLATENCPKEKVETHAFLNRPEYIVTDHRWERGPGRGPADADQMPPEDICDVHNEAPTRIRNFKATAESHNQVRLEWETRGGAPEKFTLRRKQLGREEEVLATLPGSATSYLDKSVRAGTIYTYSLVAANKYGIETEPATTMILVPKMDAPGRPLWFKAELGQNGGVVLSWKPADNLAEEFVITRFRQGLIFWYEEETFTIPATGLHEYSYTDSKGLQEGETYRYKLVARNSDSGNSGEITTEVKIPVPMVTLTLKVEPVGGGKINGHSSGSYPKGSVIELVAVPNENYEFDYWEWNGTKEYGEVFKRTINENSILIAVFKPKEEPEPPEDPPEDPGNGDTPGAAGFPWSRGAWALLYRYSFPFPWLFRLARF
ncbi:MAG TPA: PBP1A family penicillin-binding protein [Bacillota bacterium]|nr:PBP1A family penicillin-binding protein [Bacillota bacterium]HOB86213.1 PBP1A family penicillin-binding protein [Bacillota bacterium]HOP68765.1 PBP1A family penicillin-binding protein [Bacillota bacterium]HPT33868.1 PBP1A family penicillin-binding protein [Bacillota bacterium]HPZ64560.1 PBP1A family penicillin-binding protein [Bacillota bacterium]